MCDFASHTEFKYGSKNVPSNLLVLALVTIRYHAQKRDLNVTRK
jgi:hypothetical protein